MQFNFNKIRDRGAPHGPRLAAMCNIGVSSVRRLRRQQPDLQALAAADLCLGDERLLIW